MIAEQGGWAWLTGTTVAGNEVWRLLALFATVLVGMAAARGARGVMRRSAALLEGRGRRVYAAAVRALAKALPLAGFTLGVEIGVSFLVLGVAAAGLASTVLAVLATVTVGFAAFCLVDVAETALRAASSRADARMADMIVPMVRTTLRVLVVMLALLQIAQVLTDQPLTSLLAGLGVGGLAVALASQDTIKHLFGSVVLFADKPFALGERVMIDAHDGTVEEVGFRSTRLRTLEGAQVTIPNGDLANRVIQNFGRRPHIRRVANLGLEYGTPPEKVARALEIVREILKDHEGMHPDFPPRVHFTEFKADSLNLQVTYWYHPADFWAFAAFGERVNLEILRRFKAEGLAFAFPTQTVHLAPPPATKA